MSDIGGGNWGGAGVYGKGVVGRGRTRVDQHRRPAATSALVASPRIPYGARELAEAVSVLSEKRKALGAFYTPADLAAVLAEWAIERAGLRILEPSVGEGALLDAALARINAVGGGEVVGFEIDEATVQRLDQFALRPNVTIKHGDFLEVEGQGDFDLVIANPPFTRNHRLSPELRRKLRARPETQGITRGAAGLWTYFLLASLSHLKLGGRLVFVVPGATEFADYAEHILSHLCSTFAAVELVSVDDAVSWHGEAQERAAILIASGFGTAQAEKVERKRMTTQGGITKARPWTHELPIAPHVTLGSLAKLEIGSVTGANDIFLLSDKQVELNNLPASVLTPTIARGRHVLGLTVTKADLQTLAAKGERTLLLTPQALDERGGSVRRHLAQIDAKRRRQTAWLNKRDPWWKIDLGRQADGVLTYMNHFGPRIALIEDRIAATNTLHKIKFETRDPEVQKTICVSLLTSYTQAHAENIGRVYGGGVLKFELKDARRLPVLLPPKPLPPAIFARVDTALRAGAFDVARATADAELLPAFFGPQWQDVQSVLGAALFDARSLRGTRAGKRGPRT